MEVGIQLFLYELILAIFIDIFNFIINVPETGG